MDNMQFEFSDTIAGYVLEFDEKKNIFKLRTTNNRDFFIKLTATTIGRILRNLDEPYMDCTGEIKDLPTGMYKYNNRSHSLSLVKSDDLRPSLSQAALNQPWVKEAPLVIIICADYSITTSRYGSRGKRYVDIELGHVGQNIYLEATALGLGTVAVGAFDDRSVKEVLDVKEDPLYIFPVGARK